MEVNNDYIIKDEENTKNIMRLTLEKYKIDTITSGKRGWRDDIEYIRLKENILSDGISLDGVYWVGIGYTNSIKVTVRFSTDHIKDNEINKYIEVPVVKAYATRTLYGIEKHREDIDFGDDNYISYNGPDSRLIEIDINEIHPDKKIIILIEYEANYEN